MMAYLLLIVALLAALEAGALAAQGRLVEAALFVAVAIATGLSASADHESERR